MKSAVALVLLSSILAGCGSTQPAPKPSAIPSAIAKVLPVKPIPAAGQARCAEWYPPDDKSDYGEHHGPPPKIERYVRDIVSASRTVITIQSLSKAPVCVNLSWINEVTNFRLSDDKRFLDFDHEGFESWGHLLIDRRSGQQIETGSEPSFSDDGSMLVSVPPDRDDEDGFVGIGVWQVLPGKTVERAILPVPKGRRWQVDRWANNRCAELSAVSDEDYEKETRIDRDDYGDLEEAFSKLPRLYFRLREVAGKWEINPTRDGRPCFRLEGIGERSRARFEDGRR